MRKCLTKFSRILECGAVQKCANLVDLVKSFQTSIYYLLAKFGVDTAENGPLKARQKLAKNQKKIRKKFRTTQAEHKAQGSAGTGTKDARAIENGDQEPRPAIGSASAALRELIVKEYMIFHAFE